MTDGTARGYSPASRLCGARMSTRSSGIWKSAGLWVTRGAWWTLAAAGGPELRDRTSRDRDREFLAGFGATQDLADVVAQLLLRDHLHAADGSRTATVGGGGEECSPRLPGRVGRDAHRVRGQLAHD